MTWEGLEEVVAIADAGTFAGGAAVLGISTSHISRVVARLESRVGATLFNRTTRRVSLTDTGRSLVEQSRRIIQERDELLSLVNGSGEPQGELRITCSIALGERFVAPIVSRFTEENPKVSVSLDLTNRIVDIVGEGYDIGVRTGDVSDARLIGRQIASRPIEVCASPSYLKAHGTPRSIKDLESHQCLVGTSEHWHFMDAGTPRIFTPRARWRCNSGFAVVNAAISGMGICQLPSFYIRTSANAGQLKPILRPFRAAPEPIWVVYPQRRHLLPKVRGFVDLLETLLQSAIDVA